jgi:hypothetical protein
MSTTCGRAGKWKVESTSIKTNKPALDNRKGGGNCVFSEYFPLNQKVFSREVKSVKQGLLYTNPNPKDKITSSYGD